MATDQPQMAHAMKDANETSLSLPTVVRDPTRPHADTSIVDKKTLLFRGLRQTGIRCIDAGGRAGDAAALLQDGAEPRGEAVRAADAQNDVPGCATSNLAIRVTARPSLGGRLPFATRR